MTRDFVAAIEDAGGNLVDGAAKGVQVIGDLVSAGGDGVADVGNGVDKATEIIQTDVNKKLPTQDEVDAN